MWSRSSAALLGAVAPLAAQAQAVAPIISDAARIQPVLAKHGMVASQEARATRIGVDVLKAGGNAVDAAVAVGFALAVTLPRAGNIGGGGFMLVHLAARNETVAIDYRETAPAATTRDVFLDAQGNADPAKSRDTGLSVGVPGTVAGMALALAKYGSGKFTLAQLLEPAIAAARNGVVVEDDLADSLPRAQARLTRWPSTRKIFANSDGGVLQPGQSLVQADLAGVLDAIARDGPRAFYRRADRREDRRQRARGGRPDDGGRPCELSRHRAAGRARQLSRLRHTLDAAALLRRRAPDPDPQHPRRFSAARDRRGIGRDAAPDDRGDEARLCGSRRVPRRSGFRQGAGRRA